MSGFVPRAIWDEAVAELSKATDSPALQAMGYSSVKLTEDQVFHRRAWKDERYIRRVERTVTHPPSAEDWAEYEKAVEALEFLRDCRFYEEGGPDYESTVEPPGDRYEYIYLETKEEWRERCRQMLVEEA